MFRLRIKIILTRIEVRILKLISFTPKLFKTSIARRIAKNMVIIDNGIEKYNIKL